MRGILPPLTLLAGILAFSLWNSSQISSDTLHWDAQLKEANALAQSENWPETISVLANSYNDWSSRQTYLHIVSQHSIIDEADAMYRRCMAFAETRERSEFQAELAGLRQHLRLLAEMEQLTIRNTL